MELQVSIDLNPCGQVGLFSFIFGVHNARGIFFGFFFFFFWIGKYYRIYIINRSQIQTATSEAITTSKNLGISSTHASKHYYYYYYFEVISSFGSKYYLYMLRVFRKLIMTL